MKSENPGEMKFRKFCRNSCFSPKIGPIGGSIENGFFSSKWTFLVLFSAYFEHFSWNSKIFRFRDFAFRYSENFPGKCSRASKMVVLTPFRRDLMSCLFLRHFTPFSPCSKSKFLKNFPDFRKSAPRGHSGEQHFQKFSKTFRRGLPRRFSKKRP